MKTKGLKFYSVLILVLALVLVIGILTVTASTEITTFIGLDPGAGSGDARPNSDAAATNFDAAAAAFGYYLVEDFESAPLGSFTNLVMAGGILTTSGWQNSEVSGLDLGPILGYNTTPSGLQHLNLTPMFVNGTASIIFNYVAPVQAWGAYFTGIGTVPNTSVHVRFDDGSAQTFQVPGDLTGGVSFFGFIYPGKFIESVRVEEDLTGQSTRDIFSIDDVRIAFSSGGGFVTGGGWFESLVGAYYPQDLPFYDGSYYELFDAAEIPWEDANDLVSQLSHPICAYVHLATVTTAEEDQFIVDAFGTAALFGKWLGGLQSPDGEEPSGGWGWVTGETWDYTNWNGGEPNDSGGNEDHLEYWNNGMWNDEGYLPLVTGYLVEYDDCFLPTGKATFGFVSKYKKGATTPDGNTEFQFHAADLNFHSDNYDWLLVTGSNYARFKGVGTINGESAYKFMLWAGDGDPDTFRIKIWTEDENGVETVVYDNGFDQAIEGGSIVIHTK